MLRILSRALPFLLLSAALAGCGHTTGERALSGGAIGAGVGAVGAAGRISDAAAGDAVAELTLVAIGARMTADPTVGHVGVKVRTECALSGTTRIRCDRRTGANSRRTALAEWADVPTRTTIVGVFL